MTNIYSLKTQRKKKQARSNKHYQRVQDWILSLGLDEDTCLFQVVALFVNDERERRPEKNTIDVLIKCKTLSEDYPETQIITIGYTARSEEVVAALQDALSIGTLAVAVGTPQDRPDSYPYIDFNAHDFKTIPDELQKNACAALGAPGTEELAEPPPDADCATLISRGVNWAEVRIEINEKKAIILPSPTSIAIAFRYAIWKSEGIDNDHNVSLHTTAIKGLSITQDSTAVNLNKREAEAFSYIINQWFDYHLWSITNP